MAAIFYDGPFSMTKRLPRSLTVLHSADPTMKDRVIPIGEGVTLGRGLEEKVDVAINDRLLSRRHATISPVGATPVCQLLDHGSRNGSFADGQRVTRMQLPIGSIIRLGVSIFVVTSDEGESQKWPADKQRPADNPVQATPGVEPLLGRSDPFCKALAAIEGVCDSDAPVTILGELGTGKKHVAKTIHLASDRAARPFVVVRCGSGVSQLTETQLFGGVSEDLAATVGEGFLPAAEGGTLVFDEIDLLEPRLQDAVQDLLTTSSFVQVGGKERRDANVRVIAASGANLSAAADAGAFSKDLLAALGDTTIHMPALRHRRQDIPLLARHFLKEQAPGRNFDWSATCLEKLLLYDWPANVRELATVMRRLAEVDDGITMLRSAHLPRDLRRRLRQPSDEVMRASVITVHTVPPRLELADMLQRFKGNITLLAAHYMKDRRHVYRWLLRHDLSASDYHD